MKHQSIARRCAAVTAAAALALGGSALLAPGAEAKPKPKPLKGSLTRTVLLNCDFSGSPFEYNATIKLNGVRAKKTAKPVKLTATMSDLPGVAPVPLDYDAEAQMKLTVGSVPTVLKGKGHLTAAPSSPAKMFPMKGTASTKSNALPVTVNEVSLTVFGITVPCTPAEGQGALGTLKLK